MAASSLMKATVCLSLASPISPVSGFSSPRTRTSLRRLPYRPLRNTSSNNSDNNNNYYYISSETKTGKDHHLFEHHYERFLKFRSTPHHAPHIDNILLLSDLHCDYLPNREWLQHICSLDGNHSKKLTNDAAIEKNYNNIDYSRTMILVAGDVSHDLSILRWTLQRLKNSFGEVAFVPGNHELWLDRERMDKNNSGIVVSNSTTNDQNELFLSSGEGDGCNNSIEKLEKVLQICLEENIRIGPIKVGSHHEIIKIDKQQQQPSQKNENDVDHYLDDSTTKNKGVWVIPLLSFHHKSFDTEPQIDPTAWKGIPSARRVVADYRRTAWPEPLSPHDDSVAEFLDGLNDVILDLDDVGVDETEEEDGVIPVLSFSHFLPRVELLPEKRYLSMPTLHSCVGSTFLETRLRHIGRQLGVHDYKKYIMNDAGLSLHKEAGSEANIVHLHAFGHTHLSWDAIIEGVRYVHVPLAYPREWEQRRRSLEIGTMKGDESEKRFPVCIWSRDGNQNEASVNYHDNNNDDGFPSSWLGGWWSKYYTIMERQPHRSKELAPWVARRFRRLPGGIVEDFDHVKVEMEHRLQHPSHWTASGQWYQKKR